MTRHKICGVRTPGDVAAAVGSGAWAVGLNLYPPSPRSIDVATAAGLCRRVPLWVDPVLLFVEPDVDSVRAALDATGARTVQLHGAVTPDLCAALKPARVILGRPAVAGRTLAELAPFLDCVDAVLLDSSVRGLHGGTGQLADWDEARAVREALAPLPLILAGGLTADNVPEAIAAVRPYAVDVASGTERSPGEQDPARIAAFGEATRRAG